MESNRAVGCASLRWLFGEIYNEREFLRRKRHYTEDVKANMAG